MNWEKNCYMCSIYKNSKNECCITNTYENIDFKKKNNLSDTDIHHFIPKIYFKNSKEVLVNWKIIHDPTNLILLYTICHQSIHKGAANK